MSYGFENGQRVEITSFDPGEAFEVPILHLPAAQNRRFYAALEEYIERRVRERVRAEVTMELQRFLGEIPGDHTAAMVVDCYKYAVGLIAVSEQAIADQHGVVKATVSKRVVEITERLRLPPARGMKSLAARATFSRLAKVSHAKRRKSRGEANAGCLAGFTRELAKATDMAGR